MRRCSANPLAALTLLLTLSLGSACGLTDALNPAAGPTAPATPTTGLADLVVSHPTVWVCRPGTVDDHCSGGLDATIVGPYGLMGVERFQPAADPAVDCFYVYPTVSGVGIANAPLKATDVEIAVVRAEVSRFASVCRIFAPAYEQYTVVSRLQPGGPSAASRDLAFADVQSAWHDYLVNDNQGRPVVLIGDDQGAEMLLRLLRDEVERDAAQRALLVSALLIGADVRVPPDSVVGGDLTVIPGCERHDQFGCVVAFSAYQGIPPAGAWFGESSAPSRGASAAAVPRGKAGLLALCSNPAALGGGAATLAPYLPATPLVGAELPGLPPASQPAAQTGYVTLPEYLTAECRQREGQSWLEITPRPAFGDRRSLPRLDSPPSWGLHAAELYLTLGDLIELVGRQSSSYLAARGAAAAPGG
jgi:hypothetical protein